MVNTYLGVHAVNAELCVPEQHCYSCNKDENGYAYQWCLECGHGYASPRELRRAYVRTFRETTNANPDMERGGWWRDQWYKFLKRFTSADDISFCPLCTHDF